jgi:hypothetical protein
VPEQSDEEKNRVIGLQGKYANYFQVGHNAFEFVIDFGQLYSEARQAQFHTRIITSPTYARELSRVLIESLKQYEKAFGPMKEDE